ncbi:MAG: hypothetical protein JNG88_18125 [Phycisphaerales bacterium]|nr:hypothetical protein [Phycisphaerales bacterium]
MNRLLGWTMFWMMIAAGAAMLVPGILMPAYSEYQVARLEHANARLYHEELQRRYDRLKIQIEHQRNDPAYVQRQLQLEYGITPDGVQPLIFETAQNDDTAAAAAVDFDAGEEPPIPPAATELAREAMNRSPLTPLLLDPQTRPIIMLCGVALILTAIFVLGRPIAKPVVEA